MVDSAQVKVNPTGTIDKIVFGIVTGNFLPVTLSSSLLALLSSVAGSCKRQEASCDLEVPRVPDRKKTRACTQKATTRLAGMYVKKKWPAGSACAISPKQPALV